MIFAILGGKITLLKTQRCRLKNSHCEVPRRWYSLSFLIAYKTVEVCTNDGGILLRNFKKNNHDFYIKCLTDTMHHYLRGVAGTHTSFVLSELVNFNQALSLS